MRPPALTPPSLRTAVAKLPSAAPRTPDISKLVPSPRSFAVGVTLIAAAVGLYVGARGSDVFAVRTIEVHGAPPRVAREVREALRPILGESLLALDADEASKRLAAVPDVQSAAFDRAFPHSLVVLVRAERPVAVVRRGASAWVGSARGRVLRQIPLRTADTLPRVWVGKDATVRIGATLTQDDGGRATAALGAIAGTGFGPRILYVRTGRDEVTFVLRSGVELRLGDPGDIRLKLAIARRILRLVGAVGAPGTYLDVSVPERPVTTLNPQVEG